MEEETKNEKTTDEGSGAEEPQTETTKAEETNAETEDAKREEVKAVASEAEDTEVVKIEAEETAEEEKPLDKMTAPELREIAREIPGVDGVHAMKKQELLAVIKEARGIKDEEPAKKSAKEIIQQENI